MPAPQRIYSFIKSFPRGIDSSIDPLLLPSDQLAFATNASMRGNFIKQRPSFLNRPLSYDSPQTQTDFQTGLFQGATYYRSPSNGYIFCSVGGKLFAIAFSSSGTVLVSAITQTGALPNPDPSIPVSPSALAAVAGNATVALTWTPSDGATIYNVLRSITSGSGYASIGTTTNSNYTDSTAANGVTYYYVVTAQNIAGTSANSNQASATPIAPATPKSVTLINGDSPAPGTPVSASLQVYLASDTTKSTLLATTTGNWTTIAASGSVTISMILSFSNSVTVGQNLAIYAGALKLQTGQVSTVV